MEPATCRPIVMVSLTSQWLTSHPFISWLTRADTCWIRLTKIVRNAQDFFPITWADIWFGEMHVAR
jgi:hypothetical protein